MRLFFVLLLPLAVFPQEQTCLVEGQVLNASTGEPLKKVQVLLRPVTSSAEAPYGALTNPAGQFAIAGVAPGRYILMADRAGFVRAPSRRPEILALSAGQRLKDVSVRLIPHGVIAGRILDEDGDPVHNTSVQALRWSYMQGRRTLVPAASGNTNDLGEYRLPGLPPGRYYINATYRAFAAQPRAGNAGPEENYAVTYHPATADPAAAVPIPVEAGNTIRGIDITLRRTRTVRISGRATAGGAGPANMLVFLAPRDRAQRRESQTARLQPEGAFEIRGVAPGAYTLAAHWYQDGKRYSASQPLDVGSSNIDGIRLTLAPGIEIEGRVRAGDGGEVRNRGLRVALQPVDDVAFTASMGGLVKEDGTFSLTGLDPGPSMVQVFGLPENHYVKSVRLGENEWVEGVVNVSAGGGPLEVLLSPNAAQVEGFVFDEKQQPAPGAVVVLAPDERRRARTDLFRTTVADQNGRFVLKGLAPGDYRLFSWTEIEPGAAQDPEFLKPYERSAQAVTVRENGRETAHLKLLPLEER